MKDVTRTPEEAAEAHVWQYESEVVEAEDEITVTVAEGTQLVGADGKVVAGGKTVTLDAATARNAIAAGWATEAKRAR